jgi:hypothetical protein
MTPTQNEELTETPAKEETNIKDIDPALEMPQMTDQGFDRPGDTVPTPTIETHAGAFDPTRVRMMVYGESGSGKTVFASSWPDVIFLDIDKGMASVDRRVARIDISSWFKLQEAYVFLANAKHNYKTAVVDSLNEAQWHAMQNTIQNFPAIRRSYQNLPSMSDYGKALDDFDKLVRYMRILPMNVLFIAQAGAVENEGDMVMPQFTGKATARNLARMMDVIGYISKAESTETSKPRILSFDDSKYLTKDRSGKLPSSIQILRHENGYEKMAQYWKG